MLPGSSCTHPHAACRRQHRPYRAQLLLLLLLTLMCLRAVDSTGRSSLQELLHAVNVAERTSSSEASELPLGQWEVEALRGRADLLPPQLLMASPAQSARKLSVEALAGMTDVLFMTGEG